jgi:hypothetical protein
MQSTLRRFKYFGLGFGIGLVFVFFFFGNRGCSWLPEGRVKTTIAGKVIVIQEETLNVLNKKGIGKQEIVSLLNNGDVAFGESKKQGNPQVYLINGTVKGKEMGVWFTLPKDGFISEVLLPKGDIQIATNSKNGFGKMINFPNVKSWVFIVSKPELMKGLTKTDYLNEKAVQKALKKSGKIDFEKSNLTTEPSPEHYITFKNTSGKTIGSRCVWFQDHVKISNFFLESVSK